jgi:phosphatidylglycerol:prolipoprotein diacylglycerol transferase
MMAEALALLTIEIGIDPELRELGGLLLTWHGVFTAIGIAAGVWLALVMGRRLGFTDDDIYSVALVVVPSGIIGARALFVMERWGTSGVDDIVDIFRLNEGGISIYGAVLGGIAGGVIYAWFRRLPVRRGLDGASFGGLLGLAIGRIGDIINGEHFAEASSLPWAVKYTHHQSPANGPGNPIPECLQRAVVGDYCSYHPAVAYEMIGDLLILGLLFLVLRYVRKDGVAFFSFILLYSLMRFGVSELRIDSREVFAGLSTPQVTALFLIPLSLLGLLYSWRSANGEAAAPAVPVRAVPATGPPGAS